MPSRGRGKPEHATLCDVSLAKARARHQEARRTDNCGFLRNQYLVAKDGYSKDFR
jgi:hypothetical protein